MREIGRETTCRIAIAFDPDAPGTDAADPITITIDPYDGSLSRCHDACVKITGLLASYLQNMNAWGAKGRLIYEIASRCQGPHRIHDSTSGAVEALSPYGERGRDKFISLVELPDINCAKHLLNWKVMKRIRETGCYLSVCCRGYNIPVWICDPYVLLQGDSWQGVDRGVKITREILDEQSPV